MFRKIVISVVLFWGFSVVGNAQNLAVKTNLLYDATATFNAGVEIATSQRWSVDLSGNYNAWTLFDDVRYKHWLVQPELRFWFCDRFSGHFLGVHGILGQYNVGGFGQLLDYRYQGGAAGAGVAYGYDWILGRHLNLEAEVGLGFVYTEYDQFKCVGCGKKILEDQPYLYTGLTKLAINLIYFF